MAVLTSCVVVNVSASYVFIAMYVTSFTAKYIIRVAEEFR